MFPAPTHHKHLSSALSHDESNIVSFSQDILFGATIDDATCNNEIEALFLDTSPHTMLALPDDDQDEDSSIEHQLAALEEESNNFFETLETKKQLSLPQEAQGSAQRDSSSTVSQKAAQNPTLHYEECCDISLGIKESTISSKSEVKRIHSFRFDTDHDLLSETDEGSSSTQEEGFSKLFPTNLPSEVFHFSVDATKGDHGECNEKTSPLDSVLVHSFVKEYETRAKDLRICMNRTKTSRSKVAKVKQYLKKRYLQKCCSSRSKKLGAIEAVSGVTNMSEGQLSSLEDLFTLPQKM